ncbi:MAG: DUF2784 domain-containing protein [Pseudomonadota bacterium]|nr:DUF2784 domain-containing protein [Pseudomonadota bacterium]
MTYRLLADMVVLAHIGFVLFALLGALIVARVPWVAVLHVPALGWAALVELNAWTCPLTPLEQHLRGRAGQDGYSGGFVDHYLMPLLYPAGLTPRIQLALGAVVIIVNAALYGLVVLRGRRQIVEKA